MCRQLVTKKMNNYQIYVNIHNLNQFLVEQLGRIEIDQCDF